MPRFPGVTDNYLCFDDWGERLVVLRLNYHAEETVGIGGEGSEAKDRQKERQEGDK